MRTTTLATKPVAGGDESQVRRPSDGDHPSREPRCGASRDPPREVAPGQSDGSRVSARGGVCCGVAKPNPPPPPCRFREQDIDGDCLVEAECGDFDPAKFPSMNSVIVARDTFTLCLGYLIHIFSSFSRVRVYHLPD